MIDELQRIFNNSVLQIQSGTLCWKEHIIRLSEITEVWTETCIRRRLPFHIACTVLLLLLSASGTLVSRITLPALAIYLLAVLYQFGKDRKTQGVHLQTRSGSIYTFLTGNPQFAQQVCGLLGDYLTVSDTRSSLRIDFSGKGEITNLSPPKEEHRPPQTSQQARLIHELQLLLHSLTQERPKEEALVQNTIQLLEQGDQSALKEAYGKFVTRDLIGDCNSLGLNTLLNEIKMNLY